MNKKIIYILFVLFILPVIYAESSFFYKTGELIDLRISCFNEELNNSKCTASAQCNMSINYPNGSSFKKDEAMTNNGVYHNYSQATTNTTGEYSAIENCCDGLNCGYSIFYFTVNNTGSKEKPFSLIISIIIILFIITIILLAFAFNIEGENKIIMGDRGNPTLELNYGYYLKMLLYGFAYMSFWGMSFFAWQMADKYMIFEGLVTWLNYIFIMLTILIAPTVFLLIGISIAKFVIDSKDKMLMQRGLKPR